MADTFNNQDSVFTDAPDLYGTKINSVPVPQKNIGIDTNGDFYSALIDGVKSSMVDISKLESFTQVSQNREMMYEVLDTMCEDTTIAAAMEIYAEDSTELAENGRIVWCQSEDESISKYITYLLDVLNVDKNIFKWVYCLCKYGDVYLRLFRTSDMEDGLFSAENISKERKDLQEKFEHIDEPENPLNESVTVHAYDANDRYAQYVEMVPNPAEMFELTKFGKTYAYIKAPVRSGVQKTQTAIDVPVWRYMFKRSDVTVYDATTFVHASLEDDFQRFPEVVDIFLDDDPENVESDSKLSYTVRHGQSILYSVYKLWRSLTLLENSLLLNRLTKSSVLRIINVEVGDMPKENVGKHMMGIKALFEQKSALDTGNMMSEYTNPGPMENCIYVPIHNGIGNITPQQVGGDIDVKGLSDIDYFQNKMFSGLKIPKQYLGCLRGNTPILLLNGTETTIEEMFENKDSYIGKGIMACDRDGHLVPTTINNIMLTKPSTGFYRIHLDNGEYVDVTYDHRMMLRDGSYVLAEDLEIGDSLMPYYDYVKDDRRYVLDNKLGKFRPQYRVVSESVNNIPEGYQVHHINSIKIDDDFDNLIPLSVEEHCRKHHIMLHKANKEACAKRRAEGTGTRQKGSRMINNGVRQFWIKEGEDIPKGYTYGMLPFTEEHKENIRNSLTGVPKNYNAFANFGDNFTEHSKQVKLQRKLQGMYTEQYKKKSEELKRRAQEGTGMFSLESKQKQLARIPENRRNKDRYVRCLCCGTVEKIKCNDDWYKEYLDENTFWFCSKECSKLNGGGKLGRSYQLLLEADNDPVLYEDLRNNTERRKDSYFRYSTLETILPYIDNYTPECNHKVVDIEYIDVQEPAYDISVSADCHTFALPCGIFVHNCTDDSTGFNGGTALSLISSRYAKTVKRIQSTTIQLITDLINLLLLDKGLVSYVNKFTLRMQPPTTQEEIDRRDNLSSKVGVAQDIMNLVGEIEDPVQRLKILKILLSEIIEDPEVINVVQEEIDKLENGEAPVGDDGGDNDMDIDIDMHGGPGGMRRSTPIDNMEIEPEEIDLGSESGEEMGGREEMIGELPSPADLGIDMTDTANM